MLNSIIDLAKRYLFQPLHGKVVLALLALAGAALTIGFGADTQLRMEGIILGVKVFYSYENKSSFWHGLLMFVLPVSIAIWLFFKVSSSPIPLSEKIAKLEDAFRQRGNQNSVCTLFSEVYGVSVSPLELDDLMLKSETSVRASLLKKARCHVEFKSTDGFQLKYPRYLYRLGSVVLIGIYFVTALLCLPFVTFIAAAIAMPSYTLAAQFFDYLFCSAVIAWLSLDAYSTFKSALSLTK